MNESEFVQHLLSSFRHKHCRSGQQVFFTASREFSLLPDMLASSPHAKIHSSEKIIHISDKQIGTLYGIETSLSPIGWRGSISFQWKGQPVYLQAIQTDVGISANHICYLIACKSLSISNDIHQSLQDFKLQRRRLSSPGMIHNANGSRIKISPVSWDSIFLPDGIADDILNSARTFFSGSQDYEALHLPYRRGFLFSGPPGCGKTMTIKALVSSLDVFSLNFISQRSRFELQGFEEVFEEARKMAPCIIILEDLDKIGRSIPISLLLNTIDGLDTLRGVLIIATTNEPDKLDPALLLRPSRFDRVWTFPLPGYNERLKFLRHRRYPIVPEPILDELAQKSQGFSMAYMQEIFATALSLAMTRHRPLSDKDLLESVDILHKQIKNAQSAPESVGKIETKVGFSSSDPHDSR